MKHKTAYFVGIKGVAMTALAVYFQEKGYEVIGSDVAEKFATDNILKKRNIKVNPGFFPDNINKNYDLVVVTGAHGGMTNIEAEKARKMGLSTYMHGEILGKLMNKKKGISISGCHGKTTTSAIVASLLVHSGFNPSYIVGSASINDLGEAGHYGQGEYFVAEADEYMTCPITNKTPRFMWQKPIIVILTNIDYDHPDAFTNLDQVKETYLNFIHNLPENGSLIACIDDPNVSDILPRVKRNVITYGFSPRSTYRIDKVYCGKETIFMKVLFKNMELGEFMMKIPGKHNLLNGLAASIAANMSGISWDSIKENLKLFTGTKRRFEKIGSVNSTLLYDDYAHHPSEVVATLKAVKEWYPDKRLIIIFQPHTYSRTKALLHDFSKAFTLADIVIFSDIYASKRESNDPTISSKILTAEANKYKRNAHYLAEKEKILKYLSENVKGNDLIMTMGAGDIFSLQKDLLTLLKKLIV